jgi:DNA polymerase elongation subunit (family B)
MGRNLFIDAEWFLDQRIYLVGYAYNLGSCNHLFDYTLNRLSFASILRDVDAIYCYGPDIGMLEKFFDIDLKNRYYCFNLLSIIRKLEPELPSYKLCDIEQRIGIERKTKVYKSNIWNLHKDWYNPLKRGYVIYYNREDVLNLIRVKNYYFQLHGITRRDIEKYRM